MEVPNIGQQIVDVEVKRHHQRDYWQSLFVKGEIDDRELKEQIHQLDEDCDSVLERIELTRLLLSNKTL